MAFEVWEHTADAGVRGRGATLGEAFAEAACAMFSLMVDLDAVQPKGSVDIALSADGPEALLVGWLGELLAQRDIQGLVFARFEADVKQRADGWHLTGKAHGEPLDVQRHDPKVEVKAATYHRVRVERTGEGCLAECVVDL